MSISDNYVPIRQLGNGVTTMFSGTWAMLAAAYAAVFLEDATTHVQTPQTGGGTDYTLAFSASGFTVTFNVAPPVTKYAVIGRAVALDQIDPYRTSKGFQGEVIEASFDKLTAITQDLSDQADRSLKFPLGSTLNGVLVAPVDDAVLVWDGTTGLVKNGPSSTSITTAAAAAAASAATATTQAGIATTQAGISTTQAGISTAQAVIATTQAGNASTSATNSSTSAIASQAAAGSTAFAYVYNATTTMSLPLTGQFRLNSGTLSAVTAMAVNVLTGDTSNPNILNYLLTLDDSTNAKPATIILRKDSNPGFYAAFQINGSASIINNTTWVQIPLTFIGSNSTLTNLDGCHIQGLRTGNDGLTPSVVPWAVGGGTGDAITGAYTPTVTVLTDGLLLNVRSPGANTLINPTFKADATATTTITQKGGAALTAGNIPGALAELELRYNLANTRWELLNPALSAGKVANYQATDATNISLSAAPTQANLGTAFSATIPTKGLIDLLLACTYNFSTTSNSIVLGLRIGGVNYFPISNDGGTYLQSNVVENSGVDRTVTAFGKSPSTPKGDTPIVLDIQSMGIPTGLQTIQPIVASNGGTCTIKGTVTVSKFYVRINDHT